MVETVVETVQSVDGTTIAVESTSTGPALILVSGAYSDRQASLELFALLAPDFTTVTYDRRGRGDSTDQAAAGGSPTSRVANAQNLVDRELGDLEAVIRAFCHDFPAFVYGHSSGALLALEAASRGLPIASLVAYEPPYTPIAHDGQKTPTPEWGRAIRTSLDQGERATAPELFLRGTGMDSAAVEPAKQAPFWAGMLEIADSARYDLALFSDGSIPADRPAQIDVPALAVADGNSPEWMRRAAGDAAAAMPHGTYRAIPNQTHEVATATLAPVLIDYFTPNAKSR